MSSFMQVTLAFPYRYRDFPLLLIITEPLSHPKNLKQLNSIELVVRVLSRQKSALKHIQLRNAANCTYAILVHFRLYQLCFPKRLKFERIHS